jgi:hypothetical protein
MRKLALMQSCYLIQKLYFTGFLLYNCGIFYLKENKLIINNEDLQIYSKLVQFNKYTVHILRGGKWQELELKESVYNVSKDPKIGMTIIHLSNKHILNNKIDLSEYTLHTAFPFQDPPPRLII